jgi:hypothetical protein
MTTKLTSILWPCVAILLGALLIIGGIGYAIRVFDKSERITPPSPKPPPEPADIVEQVHFFCGACHAYPSPDTFPRQHWRAEVERGYRFFEKSTMTLTPPPIDSVVRYYEQRAPEDLPVVEVSSPPAELEFVPRRYPGPNISKPFAISNVNIVDLPPPNTSVASKRGGTPRDILACDMDSGLVMLLRPYETDPKWRVLASRAENKLAPSNPAKTEVVDLDGDGIMDILVADLGSFPPTDRHCGRVVWLRGEKDGSFTPITLLENVGRVADVRAADFRKLGPGNYDLVVGVFGWQAFEDDRVGVFYLENHTVDWKHPKFVERRFDSRHGTIHVPIADLNNDGKLDFVAVISQEHETIVAFINEGDGRFRKETLYTAPSPSYGSSGIDLVDLNGDGRLDILYTNGDTLDEPNLYKPYHGVQWLENKGDLHFEHHALTPMYGVHRAVAGDFFGTHRPAIVAASFLPNDKFPDRRQRNADAIILLEQIAPGEFKRSFVARGDCDHTSCAVGDVFGTGRVDIVVGEFASQITKHPVTIWQNMGKKQRGMRN